MVAYSFSGDTVVLLEDDGGDEGVSYVTLGNCNSNLEILFVSVLEARILWAARAHHNYRSDECQNRILFH